MAELNISSSAYGDMTNRVENIVIETKQTDGVGEQEETTWVNDNFSKWFGIYKKIPEVKIAFDMRTIWTIGKGFKADPETTVILDHISGCGIDTFNSILKNMMTIKRVGGDAFAEIIRDEETGELINLKVLDPASMRIVFDRKGIIKRYEQISKVKDAPEKFEPEEILHLCNKRVADEIHGVSDIEALEEIINANRESFADMRKLMHRFIKPIMKFALDTDDPVKIAAYAEKMDKAVNLGENIYIPMKAVEQELISVPSNSTLNSSEWRQYLKDYFFQVVGIPQIIMGGSGEFSEASAKIAYLAFEQSVDDEQNDIEQQIWNQLALRITLSFPASLRNEMISDVEKDGQNAQTNATINPAGVEE